MQHLPFINFLSQLIATLCSQDRIRQLHRELLKQVRKLYNAPRLVDMLVHGLASKNNRTRVEAAEAIGEIIHDEGVHVADKARHKPLPALAQVSGLAVPTCNLLASASSIQPLV